jgi:hypothetical protein
MNGPRSSACPPLGTYSVSFYCCGLVMIIIPEIDVLNFFATVRGDTEQVLGVVGNDYEVFVQTMTLFPS